MESRWTLTKKWPLSIEEERYASVEIEGEDPITDEHFTVKVWYDLDERGVVFKRISADEITASLVRILPFDAIRASIMESLIARPDLLTPISLLGKIMEESGGTMSEQELAQFAAARKSVEAAVHSATEALKGARPRRGRGAMNDDFYPQIANLYLDFHARHGQKCVAAMAEHLDSTPQRVSEWVRRARDQGWLTKAPRQGLAGGTAGLRLMEWNDKHQEGQ